MTITKMTTTKVTQTNKMTRTNSNTLTSNDRPTADDVRTRIAGDAAPRRWWRALDRMTLETMSPPIPTHVRDAMSQRDATFIETTDFAAAVRAEAPGRTAPSTGSAALSNADFARAIRAAAPGRRS